VEPLCELMDHMDRVDCRSTESTAFVQLSTPYRPRDEESWSHAILYTRSIYAQIARTRSDG